MNETAFLAMRQRLMDQGYIGDDFSLTEAGNTYAVGLMRQIDKRSIGGDQVAAAFKHFQSMFSHRGDGIPTQFAFDDKTRDAAQVLTARITALSEEVEKLSAELGRVKESRRDLWDRTQAAEAQLEEAVKALKEDAHVFRAYAEMHDRKGTKEGRTKAQRNMEHAERIEAVLSTIKGEGRSL